MQQYCTQHRLILVLIVDCIHLAVVRLCDVSASQGPGIVSIKMRTIILLALLLCSFVAAAAIMTVDASALSKRGASTSLQPQPSVNAANEANLSLLESTQRLCSASTVDAHQPYVKMWDSPQYDASTIAIISAIRQSRGYSTLDAQGRPLPQLQQPARPKRDISQISQNDRVPPVRASPEALATRRILKPSSIVMRTGGQSQPMQGIVMSTPLVGTALVEAQTEAKAELQASMQAHAAAGAESESAGAVTMMSRVAATAMPARVAAPVNDLDALRTTLQALAGLPASVWAAAAASTRTTVDNGFTYTSESAAPFRVLKVSGNFNPATATGTNPGK